MVFLIHSSLCKVRKNAVCINKKAHFYLHHSYSLLALLFFLFYPSTTISANLKTLPIVPIISPKIIGTIPHDPQAFTQGLVFYKGSIYESTGLHNQSSLRQLDTNGTIKKKIFVPGAFAEGLTIFNNMLVQLTWQEGTAIKYSIENFNNIGIFRYNGEGWGLTSDSSKYYMSNGSDTIYMRDARFIITKKTPITLNRKPLKRLNELELVQNSLFANVWYCDSIFQINPLKGNVTKIIDCTTIKKLESPQSPEFVLNGIAYNPYKKIFYITGKMWKKIYLVQF